MSTLSVIECSMECVQEGGCCQSVNYGKDLNNMMEHDCELNIAKASSNPNDITRNDSYIYYERMDIENGFEAESCSKGKDLASCMLYTQNSVYLHTLIYRISSKLTSRLYRF